MKPIIGEGKFQWNTGGWFGSLIGGTLWMLMVAVILWRAAMMVSLVWFACYLISVVVGLVIYLRRDRVAPYPALQLLLGSIGVCSCIAWTVLVVSRPDLLPIMPMNATGGFLMLALFPAMMLGFHLQELSELR